MVSLQFAWNLDDQLTLEEMSTVIFIIFYRETGDSSRFIINILVLFTIIDGRLGHSNFRWYILISTVNLEFPLFSHKNIEIYYRNFFSVSAY